MLVKRLSLSQLARETGERKQTVAYRLDKPDASRDETFWPRIAAKLGVSVDMLLDDRQELPDWALSATPGAMPPSRLPISADLLDFLMDTLQSPDESLERKSVARSTIKMWLQDFLM